MKKSKPVTAAYRAGREGTPLPDGAKLRHSLAHSLGMLAAEQREVRDRDAATAERFLLSTAMNVSNDPNKQALNVLISGQRLLQPGEANPARGTDDINPRTRALRSRSWSILLNSGARQDSNQADQISVVNLPRLFADPRQAVDVHTVALECKATYGGGVMEKAKTTLYINTPSASQPDHEPTNAYRIDVDSSGHVEVARMLPDATGYDALNLQQHGAHAEVRAFLNDLNDSVVATAHAYEGMSYAGMSRQSNSTQN